MIDLRILRDDPERVRASQRARGADPAAVDRLLSADANRRSVVAAGDSLRAEQKSFGRTIGRAAAAGYGIYRSHVAHMDVAASQYSFNDHAALRLAGRIKAALDPDGILSPGKQGIWPSSQ